MIEFVVSMADKVSGPAKSATSSMLSLSAQAKVLQSAIGGLEKQKVKQLALGNADKAGAMSGQIDKLKSSLNGLGPAASDASGGLDGLLAKVGELGPGAFVAFAAAGVAAFGALVVAGGALALHFSEMREQLEASFTALGKGPDAGVKTMKMLDDLSARLPQSRDELAGWAKQLMSAGITDMSKLQKSLEAVASAEAIMGSDGAAAATKVTALLAKISEAAQLHQPFKLTAKALAGIGINVDDIAAQLGVAGKDLTAQLKSGKISAEALGEAMQNALIAKGKGALDTLGSSVTSMKAKFMENIGKMFEGVNVKPFLVGLKSIADLFSQSTESGKAMKAGVTATFNAIFAVSSAVFPVIKGTILTTIAVIKAIAGALSPVVGAFKSLVGAIGGIEALTTVMRGLAIVTVVVGVAMLVALSPALLVAAGAMLVVGAMAAFAAGVFYVVGAISDYLVPALKVLGVLALIALSPILLVAAGAILLAGAFLAIPAALIYVGTQIADLVPGALSALEGLASGGIDAAGNFISGIVSGITSGAGAVIDAITALAGSAVGAFKAALGIASPSKVMMAMGGHTASGVAEGMSAGAGDVAAASDGLAEAAAGGTAPQGPAPSAPAAAKGAKGGATITVEAGAIVIQGAGGNILDLTQEALAMLLERVAVQQGLGAT